MPRKRATRIKKHTKPKKPEDDIGNHLDPEDKKQKLEVFLKDFDMEVNQRLQKIEAEKMRIQSIIEKELNVQLSYLPVEIRNMNIMDFVAAGGTVEAAMLSLQKSRKDSPTESGAAHGIHLTSKKGRGLRKGKATTGGQGGGLAPASSALVPSHKNRSRFQTPLTRQLPPVWDTPAVTPKFDVNLPFTPGVARGPRNEERLMSLAGSPVDISSMQKTLRSWKHTSAAVTTCIAEEEDLEGTASRVAGIVPHIAKTDILQFLSNFSAAKNQ